MADTYNFGAIDPAHIRNITVDGVDIKALEAAVDDLRAKVDDAHARLNELDDMPFLAARLQEFLMIDASQIYNGVIDKDRLPDG